MNLSKTQYIVPVVAILNILTATILTRFTCGFCMLPMLIEMPNGRDGARILSWAVRFTILVSNI